MTQRGNPITVWTLNRAANLLDSKQTEIIELFRTKGYNAQFGTRENTGDLAINLMPGTEYFVPIAPKCLGALMDPNSKAPDMIHKIADYYSKICKQDGYAVFWEKGGRDYWMMTEKYQGYYSLLQTTRPNFLIGYSQGSLVARYLYWLARDVFKEPDVVKGVITLSSPNFGSPLANPQNTNNILLGFAEILAIIFFPFKSDALIRKIRALLTVDNVRGALKNLADLVQSDPAFREDGGAPVKDLLQTLYDWLGGLRNDPDNAFFDLNIFRLDEPLSIIASAYQTNPEATVRGIISTNNSLVQILVNVVQMLLEKLWEMIERCFKANPALERLFQEENAFSRNDIKLLSHDAFIAKLLAIEAVINTVIMREHPDSAPKNPIIRQRIQDYAMGVKELNIPPLAHDFVIPSADQLTVYKSEYPVGGNTPNYQANHLSGSELLYAAGRKNVEYIKRLIPSMTF